MWKCRFGFHDWSKWSEPKDIEFFHVLVRKTNFRTMQHRQCKRCNLVQEKILK